VSQQERESGGCGGGSQQCKYMCGMWVVESTCSSLIGDWLIVRAVIHVMASALGTINSFWTDCVCID